MNRTKPPKGWRVRVGGMLGHGRFTAHFVTPSGFVFSNDLRQDGENKITLRQIAVNRAWEAQAQQDQLNEKQ